MIVLVAGSALFALAAPFVLYPLVLWLRARLSPVPVASGDCTPRVSLIVCAHDEADTIAAKLENALALDYPPERLEIWVASDGSTDGTVEIAHGFAARGVRVLDLPRHGKAHALDAAVQASSGEVLAFSDANSLWQSQALRALVRPLADPTVGGVAGDQRYQRREGSASGDRSAAAGTAYGERSYWSFDRWLKRWQSRSGSVVSATGAIYAVRRSLYEPPPADATDDFMVSTGVVARGRRLVFAADAVAVEPPADARGGEFRRKVRVITRGLRAVGYRRALLDPFQHGAYAVELLLHKLWRRLTWIPLVVLIVAAPACWNAGGALAVLAAAVVGLVCVGGLGLAWPALTRAKPVALAAYFVLVQAACARAAFDVLRGRRVSHWDPERAGGRLSGPTS